VAELQKRVPDRISPECREALEKLQARFGARIAHGWRDPEKQ